MRKHRIALKDDAAVGTGFAGQRLAVQQQFAVARGFLPEQHTQKRAFAAAGGATIVQNSGPATVRLTRSRRVIEANAARPADLLKPARMH